MSKEKQIDIITDLLIEFDEMGFAPTILVPNPEAYAIEWKKKLTDALQGYCKSEWISVDERLPEPDGIIRKWGELRIQPSVRVLCACKQKSGKVFVKEGYCELWGSRVVWRIPGNIDVVTHWMPLPSLRR
jgi:hypothetical protein